LKRYKQLRTANTIDTSDDLDLDISDNSTTTGTKVTFESLCHTNLSTLDLESGSENEHGETEPTLEAVCEAYNFKLEKKRTISSNN